MMTKIIDDSLLYEIEPSIEILDSTETTIIQSTSDQKKPQEHAKKKLTARKKIEELLEKKRLKELLDDTEDW